jgi:hypothetical protein
MAGIHPSLPTTLHNLKVAAYRTLSSTTARMANILAIIMDDVMEVVWSIMLVCTSGRKEGTCRLDLDGLVKRRRGCFVLWKSKKS